MSHDDAQYEAKSAEFLSMKGGTVVFHVEAAWQPAIPAPARRGLVGHP